jgi:hypothetical protein
MTWLGSDYVPSTTASQRPIPGGNHAYSDGL